MSIMRLGLIVLLFFYLVHPALAISFTIENPQTENEAINVAVSLSGLKSTSCSSNGCYLQGGLKASSTGQYFGMTKNNKGDWHAYRGNPGKETIQNLFFSFVPTDGSWAGTVSVKVNPDDFGSYHGPGQYYLRVWRYTGNSDDYTDVANELTVDIIQPTPSPSPTPTSSPTPTNAPTNTPTHTPTNSPTVTQKPTSNPTLKSTNTPTPKPTEKGTATPTISSLISTVSGQKSEEGGILGAKEESTATSSVTMERAESYKVFIITFLFIGIGCALLSFMIVLRKQFFSS